MITLSGRGNESSQRSERSSDVKAVLLLALTMVIDACERGQEQQRFHVRYKSSQSRLCDSSRGL
jgi:hypothetical protein